MASPVQPSLQVATENDIHEKEPSVRVPHPLLQPIAPLDNFAACEVESAGDSPVRGAAALPLVNGAETVAPSAAMTSPPTHQHEIAVVAIPVTPVIGPAGDIVVVRPSPIASARRSSRLQDSEEPRYLTMLEKASLRKKMKMEGKRQPAT